MEPDFRYANYAWCLPTVFVVGERRALPRAERTARKRSKQARRHART
jgi:hypothetical protein